MCSHYQSLKEQDRYWRHFGVEPAPQPGHYDMWPGYVGTMIRAHPQAGVGDEAVPAAEAINGLFGLVPHWATDTTITKSTYNARSETAAHKPSFRDAYQRGQRCIVPADAIFEPDWRSGKAVSTRIESNDGAPLILPPDRYQDWLGLPSDINNFLVPYPAERLHATVPVPVQGTLLA
ncbi:SOS response-associated peptidase family protein [Candidatus Aalborgicola defluviihabitans]|uniref:SOS response-associated peptidase family protein n=1 Tax=Candidatus Aalborgicola defluviihabitans TaxID=3386187 RepID=UPI00390A434A|nr:SOS response-associated peptidase family protein [Burkholderiales bacterium]